MNKRTMLCLPLLLAACTSLEEQPVPRDVPGRTAAAPAGDEVCVVGTLTNEGVECPAMQTIGGDLYTLLGDLEGHEAGDLVCACGPEADMSTCMQGTTLQITRIGSPGLCP